MLVKSSFRCSKTVEKILKNSCPVNKVSYGPRNELFQNPADGKQASVSKSAAQDCFAENLLSYFTGISDQYKISMFENQSGSRKIEGQLNFSLSILVCIAHFQTGPDMNRHGKACICTQHASFLKNEKENGQNDCRTCVARFSNMCYFWE